MISFLLYTGAAFLILGMWSEIRSINARDRHLHECLFHLERRLINLEGQVLLMTRHYDS